MNTKLPDELLNLHDAIMKITRNYVQSLAASEARLTEHVSVLSSILESMGAGLLLVSKDLKVLLINQQLLRLAGLRSAEGIMSKTPGDLWAAGYQMYLADGVTHQNEGQELVALAIQRQQTVEAELLLCGPNLPAHGVWLRASASPIFNEQGEITGSVAVYHDITALKRAFMRISDLYNGAPCGYQSLDPDGTIGEVNDFMLNMIGCSRDQVVNKKRFIDVLTERSRNDYVENFAQLQKNIAVSQIPMEVNGLGGETRAVLWSSTPLMSADGTLQSTRCTIFDVTQSKTIESQRDALAAIISHDIKNHLAAEAGFIEHFFPEERNDLSESDQSLVSSMLIANNQYLNLASDLLHLYRMERGQFAFVIQVHNLVQIINEVLAANSPTAKRLKVSLSFQEEQAYCQWEVLTDGSALTRVLHNVVQNALHYSPEGGKVCISARRDAGHTMIDVSDDGPGMTQSEIDNLLQPFWKASIAPLHSKSTKLGLYLCNSILRANRGKLLIESRDRGTTATICLPASQQ